MRRIVLALMGTLSGLVLVFSYHTSTSSAASAGTATNTANGAGTTGGSSGATTSAGASSGTSGTSGTFTGDAVQTRWGTVQVQITVKDGTVTKAEAVQYPQDNPRDQEINAYAVPALNQEVVQAQSAGIDTVSGATVTSDGYLQSLQSAFGKAHL